MSTNLNLLLIIILIVLIIYYLFINFTFRENFESRTRNMYVTMRKLKRDFKKSKEMFIGNMMYKIKTKFRKANI
jgi:predicted Holliday junction resolvase-like endonuclease